MTIPHIDNIAKLAIVRATINSAIDELNRLTGVLQGGISATSLVATDANATISNTNDTSKSFKFDASGIAHNTLRTLSIPDASGKLSLDTIFSSILKGLVPASGGNVATFLCADGSWQAPILSQSYLIPASGEVMATSLHPVATATVIGVADRMEMFSFTPVTAISISAVKLSVIGVGGNCKVAIYNSSSQGRPNVLLAETSSIDCSATGTKVATLALSFLPGKTYWFAIRFSAAPTLSAWNNLTVPYINGGDVVLTGQPTLRRTVAFATAAPTSWGFTSAELGSSQATAIWLVAA